MLSASARTNSQRPAISGGNCDISVIEHIKSVAVAQGLRCKLLLLLLQPLLQTIRQVLQFNNARLLMQRLKNVSHDWEAVTCDV
jgi:hypothetical protein